MTVAQAVFQRGTSITQKILFIHKWFHIKQKKIDRIILTINHGSFCVCSVLYQIMQLLQGVIFLLCGVGFLEIEKKKVICGKKFHNFSLIGCTSVVEWWSYTRVFHEISYQSVTLRLGIVGFFFAWL